MPRTSVLNTRNTDNRFEIKKFSEDAKFYRKVSSFDGVDLSQSAATQNPVNIVDGSTIHRSATPGERTGSFNVYANPSDESYKLLLNAQIGDAFTLRYTVLGKSLNDTAITIAQTNDYAITAATADTPYGELDISGNDVTKVKVREILNTAGDLLQGFILKLGSKYYFIQGGELDSNGTITTLHVQTSSGTGTDAASGKTDYDGTAITASAAVGELFIYLAQSVVMTAGFTLDTEPGFSLASGAEDATQTITIAPTSRLSFTYADPS